jgi:hypothetical protein
MKPILIVIAALLPFLANSQYKFNSIMGTGVSTENHQSYGIQEDWTGGFYSLVEDQFSNKSYLNRLNPDGTVQWSKSYDKSGTDLRFQGVAVSPMDSSIYLVGDLTGFNNGLSIMKLDSSGNVLFVKEHSKPISGGTNMRRLFVNSDGTLTAFGNTSECPGTCESYGLTVKMNANGDIISNIKHAGTNLNVNFETSSELHNGNFLNIYSSYNTVTTENERHIAIMTNNGTILNQTAYNEGGTGTFFNAYGGFLHSNGNYYVGGNLIQVSPQPVTGDFGALIELNSSLALQDEYIFNYASNGALLNHFKESSSSHIECYGILYIGPFGETDVLRMVVDPSTLTATSSRAYGNYAANDISYMEQTSDNGVIISGSTYDNGTSSSSTEIIKLDPLGNLGCNELDITLAGASASVSFVPSNLTSTSGSLSTTIETVSSSVYTPNQNMACSSLSCAVNLTYTKTEVDCNGNSTGAIDISVVGVSGSETYAWTGPSGYVSSSDDITGLEAGTYNLTITDGSCVETATAIITEPNVLAVNFSQSNPSCNGVSDGNINMTITGGTSTFTQTWTGPNSFTSSLEDISGLQNGIYNVTVNDANGCTVQGSVTLTEPAVLTATVTTMDANCNGDSNGSATANPSGGTAGFTYLWDDPSAQSNVTANSLSAGTYNVVVTDANGCTANAAGTVGEPLPLSASVTTTPSACNISDGSASAVVSGGTPSYSYLWSTSGITSTQTGLSSGTYTLDVTDGNGCTLGPINVLIGDTTYGVDLCVIKVDLSSTKNEIVWEKPAPNGIAGFNIYRDIVGTYTQIDYWPYDSLSEYVDTSAGINPNTTSYRYKVSVVDSCGNESILSDYHETIHTQVTGGGGNANLIGMPMRAFHLATIES